jgi:glycine/D-amino acid oxidase-like deaminating enzyme/nitrite reductase/ring-hydroxylating ferredoxin subunit
MKPESGKTKSVWIDTAEVAQFGPLKEDAKCDVCVVGAGIAGLTTAYLLAQAGKSVIVIDDGPICGGETQRTTAHLSNVIDDRYHTVISEHGLEKAKLAYQSHSAAIEFIDKIVSEEEIDCDLIRLDGYLFRGKKHTHNRTLREEFDSCKEVGFADIEMLDTVPLPFFPEPRMCIRFPKQGQFHVLKYLNGLARAIVRDGGQIYSGMHASEIVDGSRVKIKTAQGPVIDAQKLVVATNSPVSDWVKVHTKQAAYRTYVIAGKVPIGTIPQGLYWDTEDPYHYIRCQPIDGDKEFELLIIGGEDHRTGEEKNPESCFEALEEWAIEMFPVMEDIDFMWSGQVMETIDGLAFIGRDPAHGMNVFIATGDSGMGMTHGTIAGILLSDLILGVENEWAEVYSPSRIPIKAAIEYVYENVNTAMQYARYLQPADADTLEEIEPGEGALMRHNGKIIAAYKEDGRAAFSQCSAVCTHLGGVVQWNSVEKSWDCPAHGSRFKGTGEVINGPANCGLKAIPEAQKIRKQSASDEKTLPPPGDSGIELPPPPVM